MIRRPTPDAVAYDFWRRSVAGERVPRVEDDPQPGFYKRRIVKGGPFVPVEIYIERETDTDTGDLTADERLAAIQNTKPVDPGKVWTYCRPISREEYDALIGARDSIMEMHFEQDRIDLGRMASIRP